MTNAEAIEHLKNIIIFSYQDGYTAEAREALDIAIKALEAQKRTPMNDDETLAIEEIERVSSAQPEQKKGQWINVRHDNVAECSRCGVTGRAWMNFCFDCGADMRGEKNEIEVL